MQAPSSWLIEGSFTSVSCTGGQTIVLGRRHVPLALGAHVSREQAKVMGGSALTIESLGANDTFIRRQGEHRFWRLAKHQTCEIGPGTRIKLAMKHPEDAALTILVAAAGIPDTRHAVLASVTAEPSGSPPKRPRTQSLLTAADATDLAKRLATAGLHQRHQPGVKLLPANAPAVERYERARKMLCSVDPELLGFRLLEDPSLLSMSDATRVLDFCKSIEFEPRLGSGGQPLVGTKRKSFGVATEGSETYHVASGSATPLPPLLAALGDRLLSHCRTLQWPYASTAVWETASFEQAYVQVYPPGMPPGGQSHGMPGSTLGFHFDDRRDYGELIVGVTLCGTGKLLLASTNGREFVDDVAKELGKPNVIAVGLAPLSLYALTGLSRYDLRHAVVNDGEDLRVSVTFRSCPKARRARGGGLLGTQSPPPVAAPGTPSVPSASASAQTAHESKERSSGSSSFGPSSIGQPGRSPYAQQHALWFQGSQAISMRETIADGTYAACFQTPVADLLRTRYRRGDDGCVEGVGGSKICIATDSSANEDDEEGKEASNDAAELEAKLKREIEGRVSAPCGSRVCKFDGFCFRREPQHWLNFAHPCELAKDYCPNLAMGRPCFNKGPAFDSHNALFSHGPLPSELEAAAATAASSASSVSAAHSSLYTASSSYAPSSASTGASSNGRVDLASYRAHLQHMSIRELKAEVARRGIDASLCLERGDIVECLVSCGAPTAPAGASASAQTGPRPPPPPLSHASWSGKPLPSLPARGSTCKTKPLARRFVVNPFSTLDAKQGAWQERKREWHALVCGQDSIPAPPGAGLPRLTLLPSVLICSRSRPRAPLRSSTRALAATQTCSVPASRGCSPNRPTSTARASLTPY